MATTLTDQLPDRQRAALEHFEGEGSVLTDSCTYASGPVLVVENDEGAEIEIDDLGCLIGAGVAQLAAGGRNADGE